MADVGYKNLVRGQGQIGSLVFGKGTNIFVEEFEIEGYEQVVGDYQLPNSDERRFGMDSLTPTTLKFKFNILNNYLLTPFIGAIPNFWAEMKKEKDLAMEWRFDDGRRDWGSMKPIYLCNHKGEARVVYGRPGKFAKMNEVGNDVWDVCMAEFRRADTLSYSVDEYYVDLNVGATPQYIVRTNGDTDAWFRILIEGPATNPVITIGENEIKLISNIAAGEVVEVSSYPWQRRIVNSNRVNLSADMAGVTQYLDRLKMPVNQVLPVRWTSDQHNTWIPALGDESWAEDLDQNSWRLPPVFSQISGVTKVRFDLFNRTGSGKFIGNGAFGATSSIIYSAKKFNTIEQYSEATIVEPFAGRSAMAIMCNDTLTNGIALEIQSGVQRYMRLRRVTSPTTLGPVLSEWQNAGFWLESDRVSIEYDLPTKTYIGKLNGTSRVTFPDATDTQPNGVNNRRQGFLFDLDGNLLSMGTGFRRILAYDKAVVPAPTGRVRLLWRDAWVTV